MAKLDLITQRRLVRFVNEFRKHSGHPPTLQDFDRGGFDRFQVELGVKDKLLEQHYTTLTNGSVVKTFKLIVL